LRNIQRREFLLALGAFLIVPLAGAQQAARVWRIGLLTASSRADNEQLLEGLRQGLRALGYFEGQNYTFAPRFADGDLDRLTRLASELVRLKSDVIISVASRPAVEIIKVTSEIPVVLLNAGDPVGAGLVKTLGRPGGNVTGTSNSLTDIAPKHLDLLRELLPKLSRLAVLMNPAYKSHRDALATIRSLASGIGVEVMQVEAGSAAEIKSGFAMMAKRRADAFIVVFDPIFDEQRQQIGDLAIKGRLPGVGYADRYAYSGCLLSYGADGSEIFRRTIVYVDKILKGAKPSDLPIEQPTKFELVVNLKTAKSIGIAIPHAIRVRADRVIE
jgi:putative ABC transport system substrate-binding protein